MNNDNITEFDAIVVGTGISGGWAAKELSEKGLKTLVLERGRKINHREDYPTMNMDPWDFKHGDVITQDTLTKQPKQSRTYYTTRESGKHFFVNDLEHPYNEISRFDWMRGYHVGGRSLTWGTTARRAFSTLLRRESQPPLPRHRSLPPTPATGLATAEREAVRTASPARIGAKAVHKM